MQRWLFVPLGLLLLTIAGCRTSSMPAQRPDDFDLAYDWREGSLPPPYYYEYTLTLTPKGNCELIIVPDRYGSTADVPHWREVFQVPVADRDRLYQQLLDLGLFTQSWREAANPPIGGSTEWMTVIANDTTVKIPSQVVESQQAKAAEIYTAVKAIVPPETWAKFQAQLKEYQEANQP